MKKIFPAFIAAMMILSFGACQHGVDNTIEDGAGGLGQSCRDGAPLCDGDLVCAGGVCLDQTVPPPPPETEKFKALSRIDYYTLDASNDILHGVIEISYDEEGRLVAAKESLGKRSDEKLPSVREIKFEYDTENRPLNISHHFGKDNVLRKKVKLIYDKEGLIEAKEETGTDGVADKIVYKKEFAQAAAEEKVKKLTAVFDSDDADDSSTSLESEWEDFFQDMYDEILSGGVRRAIPGRAHGKRVPLERHEWVEFGDSGFPVQFVDSRIPAGETASVVELTYDDKTRLSEIKLKKGEKAETALKAGYSSEGLPGTVSENDKEKEFDIVPTFDQGILAKEDIKEKGNDENYEQRIFQYIELDKEPITPPIAWIKSIMDHSSTLYVGTPEKLFGKWMFISVR